MAALSKRADSAILEGRANVCVQLGSQPTVQQSTDAAMQPYGV
jgi:hypothetical protein